jgi:hypothetical protein
MTPGKAGGLLSERLKGAHNTMSRPRRLYPEFYLVVAFILVLVVPDVRPDHRFIKPHRPDIVPSGPEYLARKVPLSTSEAPRYCNRALAFDIAHPIRNRILRRNANAHVHMVRPQVPFYYLRLLLHRKLVKYLPKMPSQYPEYPLFAFLRDEHYMVLTIPPRVAQTLVPPV